MTRKKRIRSMVTFNCVRNGSNSFANAHVSETDIPILSQLIQHLNFQVLADVCDNYSYGVFVINIFWADLNKWLHVGVFHAFADKSLAAHSLLSAPLE